MSEINKGLPASLTDALQPLGLPAPPLLPANDEGRRLTSPRALAPDDIEHALSNPATVERIRKGVKRVIEKMAAPTREEIDAKLAASEARSDARFAELLGEIRTMRAEIKGELDVVRASTSNIKATVVGTGIAVVAIVVAIIFGAWAVFGIGMDTSGAIERIVERLRPVSRP